MWIWDAAKDRANREKHGLPLELGGNAVDADPDGLTFPDPHPDGDRWNTLCRLGRLILHVTHTIPDDSAAGRLISVRPATSKERRRYEQGY